VTVSAAELEAFGKNFETITANIERVIQGKRETVERLVMCLLSGGHALIEDVPGVGKTLLAKSMARSIDCTFQRIQFTPDLLPSDITGVSVWDRDASTFRFRPGPVFANVVLGDEINRASPKTQAALLEAMEEHHVTVDATTHTLAEPFIVVATQNPIEHEGTYPLPEAQLDRFMMRLSMGYPAREKELEMLETHANGSTYDEIKPVLHAEDVVAMSAIVQRIHVSNEVRSYIIDIADATRSHHELLLGASPRAGLNLQRAAATRAAVAGRDFVAPDDIKSVAPSVLNHRLILQPEAHMRGLGVEEVVESILNSTPVPGMRATV
jgi:MoxR-like ATPase